MKSTFKKLHATPCILQADRIDIWQFSLNQAFPGAEHLLNAEEKERAQRYYFERHRRRFTIARATLRLILSRYLDLEPANLPFHYQSHGKPSLLTESNLEFNLSHAEELALLAVGKHYPLGIDLEFFSGRPYEGIGKHLFSPRENKALMTAPFALKPLVFFRLWTQKEAFIKAVGLGLSYPTKTFDVDPFELPSQCCEDALYHQQWKLFSFMPRIACSAALCYHPSITTHRYFELNHLEDDAQHLLAYE